MPTVQHSHLKETKNVTKESLHVVAYDSLLELGRNELGLRFLYKLRSNTIYTKSLKTLNDRDNQNYEENKGAIKPTGVHL